MAKRYYRKVKGAISLSKLDAVVCNVHFKDIVDKYGKEAVDILRSSSPKSSRNRYTPYFAGWTFYVDKKTDDDYGGKVWNETNYQLTHLLENGHLIVNKKGGVGWASPQPHIEEAYRKVKEPFIKEMEKVEIDVDFK